MDKIRLEALIEQFRDNLQALRGFIETVEPVLEKKVKQVFEGDPRDSIVIPMLLFKLNDKDFSKVFEDKKVSKLIAQLNDEIEVNFDGADELTKKPVGFTVKGERAPSRVKVIKEYFECSRQVNYLYESSLISLASFCEWYISQLFHIWYDAYPQSLDNAKKEYSLAELKDIGSIDTVVNIIIESKVENIIRGDFTSWIDSLKKTMKIPVAYLNEYHIKLEEVFLRRNLFVHNRGIVNKHYLRKVDKTHCGDVKIGSKLTVSSGYLSESIDVFEKCFTLIAFEIWKTTDENDIERAKLLDNLIYQNLLKEKWNIAESLCCFLKKDKTMPEDYRLRAKLNFWQTMKWQNKFEQVEKDVISEDFSAKDDVYLLAQYALLDNETEFWHLLPSLLKSEKFSVKSLHEWPIFKEVRNKRTFKGKLNKLLKAINIPEDRVTQKKVAKKKVAKKKVAKKKVAKKIESS